MKNKQVAGILNFLSRVPINNIKPQTMKMRVLKLHLTLTKVNEGLKEKTNNFREEILNETVTRSRMDEYFALTQSLALVKTVAEREGLTLKLNTQFKAEKAADESFIEKVKALMEEEVTEKIDQFTYEEFLSTMAKVGIQVTGQDLVGIYSILKEE